MKNNEEIAKERVSIRLTPNQLEYLDRLSEEFNVSRGFIIRMIIKSHMKRSKVI